MGSTGPGADKSPIVDLEAEKTLLGAVLVSPEAWIQVSARIEPADFSSLAHRHIFKAMAECLSKCSSIDTVLLANELKAADKYAAVGGGAYLEGLTDGLPRITNLPDWCGLLRELRIKREYLARCAQIKQEILEGTPLQDIQAKAFAMPRELLSLSSAEGIVSDTSQVYREAMEDLDKEIVGFESGVPTLLKAFNRNLRSGGAGRGQTIYVGGRPSRGKTALLLNWALGGAAAGKNVLFFSLEMPPRQLASRHLLAEAQVDMYSLRRCSPEQSNAAAGRLAGAWERVLPAIHRITFSTNKRRNAARMLGEALTLKEKDGLDLIVIDYLGYVAPTVRRKSLYEETTEKSAEIKNIASELDVPVVCGVQLHRSGASDGEPRLSDFRDSGAIEQDADIAVLIHQDSKSDALQTGEVKLIIAKQRNGWTGSCNVWFDAPGAAFMDLEDGYARSGPQNA